MKMFLRLNNIFFNTGITCGLVLLIAVCLCFNTSSIRAQGVKFTTLSTKDGLSSNTIHAITKDGSGQLWFATEDGLNRFNGKEFKLYKYDHNDTSGLQAKEISALHQDKAGRLWVGTMGGSLHLYNRNTDSFIHYRSGKGPGCTSSNDIKSVCSDYLGNIWLATFRGVNILDPKTNRITQLPYGIKKPGAMSCQLTFCVFEDSKKRMWVGTEGGLYQYNRKANNFYAFVHNNANPNSLGSDSVNTISEDKQGQIWVGTNNGLSKLLPDGKSFKNFRYSKQNQQSISGNTIYTIVPDDKDHIWLGTEGGLDIMNLATEKVTRYKPDGRNRFSLTGKSIRCIYIDNQGIYWVGTYEGGINKYDKNLTLFNLKQPNEFDASGLNAPFVTSFAERKNGDIYIGTDGGGLNLYSPQTGLFNHISIKPRDEISASGLPILSMLADNKDQLWIGTFRYGLFVYNTNTGSYQQFKQGKGPSQINHNDIFCIKQDSKGKIWIGTNGGGVNVFNAATKTFLKYVKRPVSPADIALPLNGYIRAIEEDKQGNIWIASFGTGIAVLDPQTQKTTIYDNAHTHSPIDKVSSLLIDRDNKVWIGTAGDGLVCFDPVTKKFTVYSQDQGLPNEVIHKVLQDNQGKIWVSTNKGISCLSIDRKKFTNYSKYNGLQNNCFTNGAGIQTSNGYLYFGGVEGFNYFNPLDIKLNKNIPPVLFTDIKIDNKPVSPDLLLPVKPATSAHRQIYLNYRQNFTISYAALNYTSPQQNQYAYRLQGFDKDWNYAGKSTSAHYTNLDPGKYIFQVKASNNDGVWNTRGSYIEIIINPPFWMTWYACIIYISLIAGVLLYIRHRGILKLKKRFALQQEKREAERQHDLDMLKIKFLTNLSHEFRTPIALIMGPADKLLTQYQDSNLSTQINLIKRNARRLLNLVNQLLDFRKMEENELRLSSTEGEIISYIKEVTESFQDLAEIKKIEFAYSSSVKEWHTAFDHDKIERILFNLLANAFKFTPQGGKITVTANQFPDDNNAGRNWLKLAVTDTGIGIPNDKIDKIFERFFQNDVSTSILNQGSGIGLSITKEFVQMHGGSISVQSEPGKGSCFTIEIPLLTLAQYAPLEVIAQPVQALTIAESDITQTPVLHNASQLPSILIAEDNDDFRFYLKDNLKSHYKVTEAANGKDAWQRALSCHPDLIISDVSMPYMDGMQLSRKLKADKRTGHIPIILLTALAREEDQLKGLETGASDYLTKPFNFQILRAKINNLLELNRTLKKTYTKQIKVSASDVQITSSDEKFLNKVVLYIEDNLNNPQLTVEELSNYMGMSRGALYNKLLELTGQPPVEYIRSIKLDKAAVLLEKSDMTISQIAYMVGFGTPHYFSKSFKVKFNVLPSEYMNEKRKHTGNETREEEAEAVMLSEKDD